MNYRSRIRHTEAYLKSIKDNATFYITIATNLVEASRLALIGFKTLDVGTEILPRGLGSVSRFNADGRIIIHRELPKEWHSRTFEVPGWHNTWHDVTIHYEAYPRTYEAGPEMHLTIVKSGDQLLISSPRLTKTPENEFINKHAINLFIDLFGDFQVMNEHLQASFVGIPICRKNWTLLPLGEYPWSRIESEGLLPKHRDGKRRHIRHTDELIRQFNPSTCAIGNGGFNGYVAFCFPDKGINLLENFNHGNATYVFDKDWEALSRLSKATIIKGDLAIKRIEHRKGWEKAIVDLLS